MPKLSFLCAVGEQRRRCCRGQPPEIDDFVATFSTYSSTRQSARPPTIVCLAFFSRVFFSRSSAEQTSTSAPCGGGVAGVAGAEGAGVPHGEAGEGGAAEGAAAVGGSEGEEGGGDGGDVLFSLLLLRRLWWV